MIKLAINMYGICSVYKAVIVTVLLDFECVYNGLCTCHPESLHSLLRV